MGDWFGWLFDTSRFPARWHCGTWSAPLGWMHIASDLAIWLAYMGIPAVLFWFVRRRVDVPVLPVFVLFGLFIASCGFGHLVEAGMFWWPAYRFSGGVKLLTAVVSLGTLVALVPFTRRALALPSTAALMAELREQSAAQQRSRVELELTQQQLRAATLASGAGLWAWRSDGSSATWDANSRAMFGLGDTDEVGGLDFLLGFVAPNDRAAVRAAFAEPGGRDGSFRVRFSIVRPSGASVEIIARGAVILGEGGARVGTTGAFFSISAEDHARELFRHGVEASPGAMLLVDRNGTIVLANSRVAEVFGHERATVIGMNVDELVPAALQGRHGELRARYFAAPTARPMGAGRDLFGLRRDGTQVPVEIGLNPIDTPEGTFVLASIIDITQRKRDEDLLRRSLVEKDTLLHEVHHRVKNNMQVVSSLLNLQAGMVAEPRYRALFEDCQARVRTMALIHDKLYERGNLAGLDSRDFVRELAKLQLRALGRGNVKLELSIALERLDMQTAVPIGLLVNELVTNSLKHAFPDGRAGVVRVALSLDADENCTLVVADDGRGLPAPFDPTASTGLGMRIVRSLVRQLDGTLTWSGERGTTMTVRFPLPSAAPAAAS